MREGDYLKDPGVDGRIILNGFVRGWIDLAQHRDGWRVSVNAVMNFRVP
jgi:hypothetical protein